MRKTLLSLSLIALLYSCSTGPYKPDKIDAQLEAEHYVETLLKSPSTAEFGLNEVMKFDDHTFKVDGYVDSQNGFGAMVRNNYKCKVVYTKDFKQRTIEDFEISE